MINNLMYIELKTGYSDDDPAWIGYVKTSKSTEIIKQRSQTNRMCYWLMKSIMKIEIENDTLQLGEFDSAMRYFSDSK